MRAAEIIGAYGADKDRWPAQERSDAWAMVLASPALQALVAEAALIDDAIARWAAAPPGAVAEPDADAVVDRALRALPSPARPQRLPRWPIAGGALAAAIAVAIWLGLPEGEPGTQPTAGTAPTAAPSVATPFEPDHGEVFAMVFTPTPEEEELL